MTTNVYAVPAGSVVDPAASWHLTVHLECFWPSRRVDEFDGLCPAC